MTSRNWFGRGRRKNSQKQTNKKTTKKLEAGRYTKQSGGEWECSGGTKRLLHKVRTQGSAEHAKEF